MRVKPVRPIHGSFDRDERFDDEERRYRLIHQLSSEMDLPAKRLNSLLIPEKRKEALNWLNLNLGIYNSAHKNYQRVKNLIALALKKTG
tara:strand:+ start:1987 stop:2253 length:267 start_codon:yes stop_codon:yes gene_type:complete